MMKLESRNGKDCGPRVAEKSLLTCIALISSLLFVSGAASSQIFIEDFTGIDQRDDARTFADWDTDTGVLRFPGGIERTGTFSTMTPRVDVGTDSRDSQAALLVDADGDVDLDAVTIRPNHTPGAILYANNGTSEPYLGVAGMEFGPRAPSLTSGDYDNDGDIDLISGGGGQFAPLTTYLPNNGTASPFAGGHSLFSASLIIAALETADMDGDGDLDIVAAAVAFGGTALLWQNTGDNSFTSSGQTRLFLPLSLGNGAQGVAIADMDWDGTLDVVLTGGNGTAERLLLNNGTADPFGGVTATDIGADAWSTTSIAAGDLNGDGGIDIVTSSPSGNTVRMHLNNLTADPFAGVLGSDIGTETDHNYGVKLGDLDGDGDLDAVVAISSLQADLGYFLNNGTNDPFAGVARTVISTEFLANNDLALGDVDGDGDLDILTARGSLQLDKVFLNAGTALEGAGIGPPFDTSRGQAVSLEMDNLDDNIPRVTLTVAATMPPNTGIDYFVSNNGGAKFSQVRPGVPFCFTTTGNDLRWKVALSSLSPAITPEIDTLTLAVGLDADCDGIDDDVDNCQLVSNADQRDVDGDGHGSLCDADFNNDCFTNFADLTMMQAGFFGADPQLDLDGSGAVNFADLTIMQGMFFAAPGPSAPGSLCNP